MPRLTLPPPLYYTLFLFGIITLLLPCENLINAQVWGFLYFNSNLRIMRLP